jgi:hypothetical protein
MALVQNVSFSFREWETMLKWVTFLTHYLEICHKRQWGFEGLRGLASEQGEVFESEISLCYNDFF